MSDGGKLTINRRRTYLGSFFSSGRLFLAAVELHLFPEEDPAQVVRGRHARWEGGGQWRNQTRKYATVSLHDSTYRQILVVLNTAD